MNRFSAPITLFLSTLAASLAAGAAATACENGPELTDETKCKYVVHYTPDTPSFVDKRVSTRITSTDEEAPPVRSYAMIVSVNDYPNFRENDRKLQPAKNDLDNLLKFFRGQAFNEIIVLENADATIDNIRFFLRDYLKEVAHARSKRARVVFAYTGHGSNDGIVLSAARNGSDRKNVMELNDLGILLKNAARETYHFLALIGSCYSGAIFEDISDGGAMNLFFPGARGAHIFTATTADELAYGLSDQKGSIFFDSLIDGVTSGWADSSYAGMVSNQDGSRAIKGGGIVRAGLIAAYISTELDNLQINPRTNKVFPQVRMGALHKEGIDGGFYFLVPPKAIALGNANQVCTTVAGKTSCERLPPVQVVFDPPQTGSAIKYNPDIKVFNAPDTYEIRGVDISHHSGNINWDNVAKSDVSYVYMKSTEGGTFIDHRFKENWKGAAKAGLARGAYHVLNVCKDAPAQFENIKRTVPNEADALPIVIDLEWYKGGPIQPRQKNCKDIPKIQTEMKKLLELVEQHYGKRPMLYAHEEGIRDVLAAEFDDYPLWLQDWTKDGTAPSQGPTLSGRNPWTMWQFAGNIDYAGIKNVDLNAFFGTAKEFESFKSGTGNLALTAASPQQKTDAPLPKDFLDRLDPPAAIAVPAPLVLPDH